MTDDIRQRLTDAFAPRELEIVNESDKHRHHRGDDGSGESHFRVRISADAFAEMSRLARHRAVHDALGKELTARIHALALDISA